MRRTWTAVVVVFALAAVAGGCGGSSNATETNPTDQWASGFCTAVTTWKDAIANVKSDVTSNPTKDGLQTAADDARSATDTLVSDIKDLGAPDTTSGQDVRTAVDSWSTTLDSEVSTIQDTVKGISSIADLPSAISTISTSVSTLATASSNALTTIDQADAQGELKTAFENAPECKDLTSSGG